MRDGPAERKQRILVAEDDPDVREVTVSILEEGGYAVVAAVTAEAALLYLVDHDDISLLLTDIRMPGPIDGWALAQRATACRPGLRVIYMTGFGTVPVRAGYGPLLPKPWTARQLLECVRRVLSGPAGVDRKLRC